jgi:TetR/AcrR family transcriptional regulator, cholesterol catabolism regulator
MTRDQILEVAAQIFRQKGFHAASMQEIAEAVNLRKASLYHHVSGKQEILLELLNQAMDNLIESTQNLFSQNKPPEARLIEAIHQYLEALVTHPDLANVLLLEYRSLDLDLQSRHKPRRDHFEKLWRDLIQEGIDTGIFYQMDASIAAKTLLGSMHWAITWYRQDGPLDIHQISNVYSNLLLKGLLIR